MKEARQIISAYDAALAAGRKTALVTLVHVEGSAYRRPGARMLIDEDGEMTGAISGGCLEGDALRKALLAIAQERPKLVSYDTRNKEDMMVGVQLGCEGVIRVLIEPIDASKADNQIALLKKGMLSGREAVVTCIFNLESLSQQPYGTCLVMDANRKTDGSHLPDALYAAVCKGMSEAMDKQQSLFQTYVLGEACLTAFIEYVRPPVSLVVIGAGNDAIPLVQIGELMGWRTTVADGRNTHAKAERFIPSCQVMVSKPEQILEKISISPRTCIVLMTHNYNYDKSVLEVLLKEDIPYIGVLGSRKRLDRMLGELEASGMAMTPEMVQRLHGPAGLEVGAETPEEIAMSIASEILAVMQQKEGGKLRNRIDGIHPRKDMELQRIVVT